MLAVAWRMNAQIDEIHKALQDTLGVDDEHSWLVEYIYNVENQEPAAAVGAILAHMDLTVEDR